MLEYCLDIGAKSYATVYTPNSDALSLPFYLLEDGYFEANSSYYTKRSDIPKYLLMFTISGSGMVRVKDKTKSLPAGSAVLIDCREYHEYRTISTNPWVFHYLHFDGKSMEIYKKLLFNEFGVVQVLDSAKFMQAINQIHEIKRQRNILLKSVTSCDLLSSVLTMLFDFDSQVQAKGETESDAIKKACAIIEENLGCKLAIEDIAKKVNLSKFYFIRLFQKEMGVSPYLYMQILRINQAKELLSNTAKSIEEISKSVGFSSCTRFSRCFFEMTGVTPSQYRKGSYAFTK